MENFIAHFFAHFSSISYFSVPITEQSKRPQQAQAWFQSTKNIQVKRMHIYALLVNFILTNHFCYCVYPEVFLTPLFTETGRPYFTLPLDSYCYRTVGADNLKYAWVSCVVLWVSKCTKRMTILEYTYCVSHNYRNVML